MRVHEHIYWDSYRGAHCIGLSVMGEGGFHSTRQCSRLSKGPPCKLSCHVNRKGNSLCRN